MKLRKLPTNTKGDETQYLMASKANKKSLDNSILQLETGKGVKVSFDDLWK